MSLRPLLRLVPALLLALPTSSQIAYEVGVDLEARAWSVEGTIENPERTDLDFWIALWTPGAYHPAEYGRFVRDFAAFDEEGRPLEVEREGDSTFRIAARGHGEVRVRYAADSLSTGGTDPYSNEVIDVEANRVTADYAYLNPVSLLGFVAGRLDRSHTVRLRLPEGWRAATALPVDDSGVYAAPDFYRLEDSPFLMSPELRTSSFQLGDLTVDVSVHGKGEADFEELVAGCERVVKAAGEFFGGFPFDRYHFLLGFTPQSGGSGLEHSYSTLILASPSFGPEDVQLWGIVAHELVHAWVAERLRVEAVNHPDFTQVLETGTIWFNEGVTEYVTQHVLLHAGFLDEEGFLEELAGPLPFPQPALEGMLGGASWTDISRATATWEGTQDLMVFALRSYILGRRTIFALDLEMRRLSGGERGIVDFLRLLMKEYGSQGRGFAEDALPGLLEQVAGGDLDDFYGRYIDGPELPDVGAFLEVIGYRVDDRGIHEVEHPSKEELAARADLFSIP